MKFVAQGFLALFFLVAPAAAQTLTTLLPAISFPEPATPLSTRGCQAPSGTTQVCQLGG